MPTLSQVVAPSVEPLDAADPALRLHLKLEDDETYEDALVESYIAAARDQVETYLRRRLITQTVRLSFDGFGWFATGTLSLPVAPVQSVAQVQYLDDAGTWQTVAPERYRLIQSCEPPELAPPYGGVWPVPRPDRDTVRVDLVVGYGDSADQVPPRIIQAIRLQVADMWANRGDGDGPNEATDRVQNILFPLVIWV